MDFIGLIIIVIIAAWLLKKLFRYWNFIKRYHAFSNINDVHSALFILNSYAEGLAKRNFPNDLTTQKEYHYEILLLFVLTMYTKLFHEVEVFPKVKSYFLAHYIPEIFEAIGDIVKELEAIGITFHSSKTDEMATQLCLGLACLKRRSPNEKEIAHMVTTLYSGPSEPNEALDAFHLNLLKNYYSTIDAICARLTNIAVNSH